MVTLVFELSTSKSVCLYSMDLPGISRPLLDISLIISEVFPFGFVERILSRIFLYDAMLAVLVSLPSICVWLITFFLKVYEFLINFLGCLLSRSNVALFFFLQSRKV